MLLETEAAELAGREPQALDWQLVARLIPGVAVEGVDPPHASRFPPNLMKSCCSNVSKDSFASFSAWTRFADRSGPATSAACCRATAFANDFLTAPSLLDADEGRELEQLFGYDGAKSRLEPGRESECDGVDSWSDPTDSMDIFDGRRVGVGSGSSQVSTRTTMVGSGSVSWWAVGPDIFDRRPLEGAPTSTSLVPASRSPQLEPYPWDWNGERDQDVLDFRGVSVGCGAGANGAAVDKPKLLS